MINVKNIIIAVLYNTYINMKKGQFGNINEYKI